MVLFLCWSCLCHQPLTAQQQDAGLASVASKTSNQITTKPVKIQPPEPLVTGQPAPPTDPPPHSKSLDQVSWWNQQDELVTGYQQLWAGPQPALFIELVAQWLKIPLFDSSFRFAAAVTSKTEM